MDVEVVYGDLLNYNSLLKATEGVDVVYHLGALLPLVAKDNLSLFDVNIKGTFYLLEAIKKIENLHRFVFASTDDTYSSVSPLYTPIDENHPQNPTSLYGVSKVIGEKLSFTYGRQYNIPITCCRFGFILGAGEILDLDYFWPISSKGILEFLKGRVQTNKIKNEESIKAIRILEELNKEGNKPLISLDTEGRPWVFHPVDVRDIVQGLILVIERAVSVNEVFNLVGPSAFGVDEAVKYLSKSIDLPYVIANLPGKRMYIEISTAKARGFLGYKPKYGVFKMIDSAVAFRKGEDTGVIPS